MERHDDNALIIYTDGSQLSRPRRGGIGIRLVWCDETGAERHYDDNPSGYRDVTVPLMELKAVIEALKLLLRDPPPVPASLYEKIVVYSDAIYLVEGHPAAKGFWPRKKWHTRNGTPVENAERWKELIRLEKRIGKGMEVRKVEAHMTNPHNKAVDRLARESARSAYNPTLSPAKLRRKKSTRSLKPGSVAMEGQRLTIHVHRAEYLRVQRVNRYRYSVESSGAFHHEVGVAFGERDINLSAGHAYDVRFNEDSKNPRIEEVYSEVVADATMDECPDESGELQS